MKFDPFCAHHGIRWSEHESGRCLFCAICADPLTPQECSFLPDGSRENICIPCAMKERGLEREKT